MAVQVSKKQAFAYSELLEILSYMEKENVDKIPHKLMEIFKTYSSDEYVNHLDANISIKNQKISEETSSLLAMLMLNYWCESEEQKKSLIETYQKNEDEYQKNLREKYNPDNIFNQETQFQKNFNNNSTINSNENSQSTVSLIDINSLSWYKKIFHQIRNFIFKFINNKKSN